MAALGLVPVVSQVCEGDVMRVVDIVGLPPMYVAGMRARQSGPLITVPYESGLSLLNRCDEAFAPESIARLQLLGRSISFNVDLSAVSCGCNIAFYLVGGPAQDESGAYVRGTGEHYQPPYYCDANQIGGQWCPEVDIMEANSHAFQATAHRCVEPVNGHYSSCDRGGISQQTRFRKEAYGPGINYMIDTRWPFSVRTEFPQDLEGRLAGMRTILSQGSRQITLESTGWRDQEYLAALTDIMSVGMNLRVTYWGSEYTDMAWMDSPPCGDQNCTVETAGDAIISNIVVHLEMLPLVSHLRRPANEAPASTTRASSEPQVVGQWLPNQVEPWQCHHYDKWQLQEADWCKHAGFLDGFEYRDNGGQNSPCGHCWCCKRRARWQMVRPDTTATSATTAAPVTTVRPPVFAPAMWAPPATAPPAVWALPAVWAPPPVMWAPPATLAPPVMAPPAPLPTLPPQLGAATPPEFAWVVSDPVDVFFGEVVPEWVKADPLRFSAMNGHGVARWGQTLHSVELVPLTTVARLQAGALGDGTEHSSITLNGLFGKLAGIRSTPAPIHKVDMRPLCGSFFVFAVASVLVFIFVRSGRARRSCSRTVPGVRRVLPQLPPDLETLLDSDVGVDGAVSA